MKGSERALGKLFSCSISITTSILLLSYDPKWSQPMKLKYSFISCLLTNEPFLIFFLQIDTLVSLPLMPKFVQILWWDSRISNLLKNVENSIEFQYISKQEQRFEMLSSLLFLSWSVTPVGLFYQYLFGGSRFIIFIFCI